RRTGRALRKKSGQPRKFLVGKARAAHNAQKNLFERELFTGGRHGARRSTFLQGRSGLRLDSGAKLFERALRNERAAMNDRHVAAKAFNNFKHVGSKEDG